MWKGLTGNEKKNTAHVVLFVSGLDWFINVIIISLKL